MSDASSTILVIQSSALREGSTTRRLAERLATRLAAAEGASVVVRDLADGMEHVDADWVGSNFTKEDARNDAQRARLAGSDALVAELRDASHVVVGAPIYNFGVPASLKAWVDQVARAGVTFRYGPEGPEGLLRGKRAYIVAATGGAAAAGGRCSLARGVCASSSFGSAAEGAGGVTLTLDQTELGEIPDTFVLATRPDGLRVVTTPTGLPCTLGLRTYLGRTYHYQADTAVGPLTAGGPLSKPLDTGQTAWLAPEPEQCCILPKEDG